MAFSCTCNLPALSSSSSSSALRKPTKSRNRATIAAMGDHRRRQSHNNNEFSGRLVEENVIVLRKRIHEMKIMEEEANEPPMEWMEWEKDMYSIYDSSICEAMGLLQYALMDTRPAIVLGTVVLLAISILVSSSVVVSNFGGLVRAVLSGI